MRLLCSILVVGVLLGGCGGDDDDADASAGDATDATDPTQPGEPDVSPLAGRTFLSESVTENGQPRALVEGTRVQLAIHDDGRLTASAGCNSLVGDVTVEADRLVIGSVGMTEMGCDPALHDQDDWLAAVLSANPTYTLDGDRLRLEGNGSVIELLDRVVADPARPLEGTVWQVDGMIDDDAVSSMPAGVVGTVVFTAGQVQVQVCNQGSGPATVGESDIQVGPLAMTRMACEPEVMDVENAVVEVLDGTVAYEIEADSLTLTHPSGAGLTLRAQ